MIALVYLASVSAGVALGRFVPLEAEVGEAFGLSLAAYGWLVSGVSVIAAGLALPTGLWIARRDLDGVLCTGLGVMLPEVMAPATWLSYSARVLEGVEYLAVVVAGPMLPAARCRQTTERRALALWSTFTPVGLALISTVATVDVPVVQALTTGCARAFLAIAAVLAVVAVVSLALPHHQGDAR